MLTHCLLPAFLVMHGQKQRVQPGVRLHPVGGCSAAYQRSVTALSCMKLPRYSGPPALLSVPLML